MQWLNSNANFAVARPPSFKCRTRATQASRPSGAWLLAEPAQHCIYTRKQRITHLQHWPDYVEAYHMPSETLDASTRPADLRDCKVQNRRFARACLCAQLAACRVQVVRFQAGNGSAPVTARNHSKIIRHQPRCTTIIILAEALVSCVHHQSVQARP
jgi:hypothetical protein